MITAREAKEISNGSNEILKPYFKEIDETIRKRSFGGYYDCLITTNLSFDTMVCKHLLVALEELGYNIIIEKNRQNFVNMHINWKDD